MSGNGRFYRSTLTPEQRREADKDLDEMREGLRNPRPGSLSEFKPGDVFTGRPTKSVPDFEWVTDGDADKGGSE